jgi:hypothetical protein
MADDFLREKQKKRPLLDGQSRQTDLYVYCCVQQTAPLHTTNKQNRPSRWQHSWHM